MKIKKNIELHGNYLRLVFMYRKVKCTESLYLENNPKNLKAAENKIADILSQIRNNTFNYADHFPQSKKISRFAVKPKSYYMNQLFENQKKFVQKNQRYAAFTKRDYINYIDKYLIPSFGKILVTELKPSRIKEWINSLDLSAKFISNILSQLRATLADAINDEIILKNPLDNVNVRRLFQLKTPNTPYKVEPFTDDEKKILLENSNGEVQSLIQFGFYSGMRIGETLALKWENIDLENNIVTVKYTMNKGVLERPKTESSKREINLFVKAREALDSQLNYKTADDFVFHNPNTGKYWTTTDIFRKHWVNLIKLSAVKYRNPYQMRHSFASMLITNGENIHNVASYLGHIDVSMVTKIYGNYIKKENSHGFNDQY